MHSKRAIVLVTLAVFVVSAIILLQGCGTKTTETKEPVKIGVVLSESGPNEPLGKPERKAIELFVDDLNAEGGIDGHQVEVVFKDDQSKPEVALQVTVELIEQEDVIAIIGSSGTPSTMSMKQETADTNIPQVCMAADDAITQGDSTWMFRTPPVSSMVVEKALTYIRDVLKLKRIGLLYDTNTFGTGGKNTIEAMAPEMGVEVVMSEGYQTDEPEAGMDTHLTNLQTANPEVIVVWGTNPGPGIIAKRMRDKGMTQPYMGSHGIANQKFIELAGAAANGVLFPAGKMLIWDKALDPGSEQYNFIKDFSDRYSAAYGGEKINTFAGHGWDAINIIVDALRRAGADATPSELRDAIEETSGLVGTAGIFTYTPSNHNGLSLDDLIVIKIVNNAWDVAPEQE